MEDTINNENLFQIAGFVFDLEKMKLTGKGRSQKLSRREADLLRLLYLNKNEVSTREYMLETIWGKNDFFLGRSMDVYISKLRKYLKFDEHISIVTIHGIGFKLEVK